ALQQAEDVLLHLLALEQRQELDAGRLRVEQVGVVDLDGRHDPVVQVDAAEGDVGRQDDVERAGDGRVDEAGRVLQPVEQLADGELAVVVRIVEADIEARLQAGAAVDDLGGERPEIHPQVQVVLVDARLERQLVDVDEHHVLAGVEVGQVDADRAPEVEGDREVEI